MFSLPEPPTLKVALFVLAALGVSVMAIAGGAYLYELAAKPKTAFYAELGSLALQLGVAVIVGALIKVVVDWGLSQRARYNEKLEARKEFMRRVRTMHVVIQNAKDLLNAHQSAKTWGEQSRRLMELRPEVEEISEDMKASHGLFAQQATIIEGLEAIILYLTESGREYVDSHGVVDSDFKNGERLATTIHRTGMTWVQDFMQGGADYQQRYVANLSKSKGAMRKEVYGA